MGVGSRVARGGDTSDPQPVHPRPARSRARGKHWGKRNKIHLSMMINTINKCTNEGANAGFLKCVWGGGGVKGGPVLGPMLKSLHRGLRVPKGGTKLK